MKDHMFGWRIFFIVLGVLGAIGAVAMLVFMQIEAAIGTAAAAVGMFLTASVCAWMDDLLAAVSRSGREDAPHAMGSEERELRARAAAGRRRAEPQEPQRPPEPRVPDNIEDAYQLARKLRR